MATGWKIFFAVSNICQWIFIICLLKQYPFVDRSLYEGINNIATKPDTYAIAVQIGRFDFITLLLTVQGIVLTVAGVFAFVEVRSRSEAAAVQAARSIAHKTAKETAEAEIKPEASRMIEEFFDRKGIDLNKLPRRDEGSLNYQALADAISPDGGNGDAQ